MFIIQNTEWIRILVLDVQDIRQDTQFHRATSSGSVRNPDSSSKGINYLQAFYCNIARLFVSTKQNAWKFLVSPSVMA
jgi:hypothetical protein